MKLENEIHGQDIRTIFERNKCEPRKFDIQYCDEYLTDKCKMTCNYAKQMEAESERIYKRRTRKI
jgi:hypothetical protein